jgi:hypothetical protein
MTKRRREGVREGEGIPPKFTLFKLELVFRAVAIGVTPASFSTLPKTYVSPDKNGNLSQKRNLGKKDPRKYKPKWIVYYFLTYRKYLAKLKSLFFPNKSLTIVRLLPQCCFLNRE